MPREVCSSPHNIKSEINMSECNLLKAKCTVRTHYSSIIIYMYSMCNIFDYYILFFLGGALNKF